MKPSFFFPCYVKRKQGPFSCYRELYVPETYDGARSHLGRAEISSGLDTTDTENIPERKLKGKLYVRRKINENVCSDDADDDEDDNLFVVNSNTSTVILPSPPHITVDPECAEPSTPLSGGSFISSGSELKSPESSVSGNFYFY